MHRGWVMKISVPILALTLITACTTNNEDNQAPANDNNPPVENERHNMNHDPGNQNLDNQRDNHMNDGNNMNNHRDRDINNGLDDEELNKRRDNNMRNMRR